MREVVCVFLMVQFFACIPHIKTKYERVREYEPAEYDESKPDAAPGSLFSSRYRPLFRDIKALALGDILTVKIVERSEANRDAGTNTARGTNWKADISSFFGAVRAISAANPDLVPLALSAGLETDFEGSGKTHRSGEFNGLISVRVKQILPNGDYFVEGQKAVMVNLEQSQLYLSGVVRPQDILGDNSVMSTYMADVELEYTGSGVVAEKQRPGWLTRSLDYISPF